jgi:hypothetical protein
MLISSSAFVYGVPFESEPSALVSRNLLRALLLALVAGPLPRMRCQPTPGGILQGIGAQSQSQHTNTNGKDNLSNISKHSCWTSSTRSSTQSSKSHQLVTTPQAAQQQQPVSESAVPVEITSTCKSKNQKSQRKPKRSKVKPS